MPVTLPSLWVQALQTTRADKDPHPAVEAAQFWRSAAGPIGLFNPIVFHRLFFNDDTLIGSIYSPVRLFAVLYE
jgi:hypothetical protein